MNTKNFPSLITADASAGLALAGKLAEQLLEKTATTVERPGGTNYLQPAAVPKEMAAGILFYAIAAANHGWKA